jgi:hypothetical protein
MSSFRTRRPLLLLPAAALLAGTLAAACADTPTDAPRSPHPVASASMTAAPTEAVGATMRFGRPDMNGFAQMSPTAMQHTQGGHAVDKVFPGTVVIRAGQTVAFESFPVHQIAVYAPGTAPTDIRIDPEHLADAVTPWGVFPDVLIDDAANRLAVSPISFEPMTWSPAVGTFARPGRYLVICTLVWHYVETRMYGWVEVR